MTPFNTTSSPGLRADGTFLRKQTNWENLFFYRKSLVLYDLTFCFTKRFLQRGDRTIDQMVQAARSCKQNIVEGLADEVTSTEMAIKLLNVARASNRELLEDWEDYLRTRRLRSYHHGDEEYQPMLDYCKAHNDVSDYSEGFDRWTDEQMANMGLTLSHMVDSMLNGYIAQKEKDFTTHGGIKEQMTAARLGSRGNQQERIVQLETRVRQLETENASLRQELTSLRSRL